jgi:hypothetical protein
MFVVESEKRWTDKEGREMSAVNTILMKEL